MRGKTIKEEDMLEIFNSNYIVEPVSGCWLWVGALSASGYGHVSWEVLGGYCKAHRLSWKLFRGPLTDNEQVLHSCDMPRCVNPDHLFKGNHQINMDDMVAKGRQQKGENHSLSKLTEAQAIAIINDTRTHDKIAADYGVTRPMVGRVKDGKSWKHLDIYRTNRVVKEIKGENHGSAKLTEAQAIAIMKDTRTYREIARNYNMSLTTVNNIKNGKRWKHLQQEEVR
jgi:uncharacterized protein YerC